MCADIKQIPNKEQKEWYLVTVINIKFVCGRFYLVVSTKCHYRKEISSEML